MSAPPTHGLPRLPGDAWLTTRDASKVLGCSISAVLRHVRGGRLCADAHGRGGRLMFRYETVCRFVAKARGELRE